MTTLPEHRYSERGAIRPGDTFRARGGSTYKGHRSGPRGLFRAVSIETDERRGRVWIVAYRVDRHGLPVSGTTLLYVAGKPYRMSELPAEWIIRPYRVARCRA